MLLKATGLAKNIGPKSLFTELDLNVDPGEKIALIGRNGQGKTTLLNLLSGQDHDYGGKIERKKNLRITLTKQEHLVHNSQSGLTYILSSVPHYFEYEKILHDFEHGHHGDLHSYTAALEYFTENGYYYIKDLILNTLLDFQISAEKASQPLVTLSGGEKRYIELARLMYSQADLLLIDEPTNHMDYIGKDQFIAWMQTVTASFIVITHDRDVLQHVDKIIELKDKKLFSFKGNYDAYLLQNTTQTTNSVKQYQNQLQKLDEAKKRVEWGLRMRAKSKAWKIRYDHWVRDYEKIKAETVKPSFWIDQESSENLDKNVSDSYHKFKEKNISIAIHQDKQRASHLLTIDNLSLGYTTPLFSHISFTLNNQDRIFIKGRNGAGKSSLVRSIMAQYHHESPKTRMFEGKIQLGPSLIIGEYQQEISPVYLDMQLGEAIVSVYEAHKTPLDDSRLRSILAQYLFDPMIDAKQKITDLSGGQKARFQIIKMLAGKPNLLILDEPTNHLDLPSIEELEDALQNFHGGILYISHDTYFIDHMGGETITI